MNIGVVCHPTYGGSGVIATELGLQMAEKGHNVHFITFEKPVRITSYTKNVFLHEIDIPNYPVFKYPPVSLAISAKIAEVCRNENIEIVHVHYALPYSISAYIAREMLDKKFKIITTLHGTDISVVGQDSAFLETVQFGINNSDMVTCVSNYLKQVTINEFSINKEIHVIPNFINHNIFTPEMKNDCPFLNMNEERTIMHLSNFRHYKNVETVVKIFSEINKTVKSRLILIGEGPVLNNVRKTAKELNVLDKVIFLGHQTYVEAILPYADLFIFPSIEESFGVALLEAMSCGICFVASNSGGIPELAGPDLKSLLFNYDDIKGMAQKGIEILSNQNYCKKLSSLSRKRVIENFNMEVIVDKYIELYNMD